MSRRPSASVREVRLDNGFLALLVPRDNLPIVASVLFYRTGSRDERTGETGVSHFLEHMMFKGTPGYPKGEIDRITNRLGGSNNAFTDHDTTAYYFALAADRWETALEIEADRMRSCSLVPAEFDAERSVVLEELAMGEDDPWRMLWEASEELTYQVHPYHRPIIGYRQDLERLTPDRMRDYYDRHYGPNRAFLVVVGDIDVERTVGRVGELFGGAGSAIEREPVLDEPEFRFERRGVVRAPGSITRIALACRTCRVGEPDDFRLDVLAHVLGHGRSSRLHQRLVLDSEIATHVSASNETRFDRGMFSVQIELRPGADPGLAESMAREELATLVQSGITAAELKRARVQIRSSFLFEDETVLDTALKLGRFESTAAGGWRLIDDVLPRYDAVGRRDVRDCAARLLGDEAWTVVWSLPESAPPPRPNLRSKRRKTTTAAEGTTR